MTDELNDDQTQQIAEVIQQAMGGAPQPEPKHNVHTFLWNVATSEDTTKTGYLKDEEVGIPIHPLRAVKEFALISDDIIGNEFIMNYFRKEAEIITSTSLSRDGFLDKLATTTTKQIADITKHRKPNKSWFKKSDNKEEEGSAQ